MIALLAVLSALTASAPPSGPPEARAMESARPPVRLWMNNDRRFREGDQARLQVDADVDGFLLVLHYDTDGRIRVLFPLDPRDDAFVRAGRRYEVRDEAGREAFLAGAEGTGLIYTAIAQDPWRFEDVVQADRWDYARLSIDPDSRNPEADLTELVQRFAGSRGFDYDVLGYRVYGTASYTSSGYGRTLYLNDDYLYCNDWYWRYGNCRRFPYDGGLNIFFGGYYPYYYGYRPYYYGSNYPYYYPRNYPYGYPYRPYGNGRAPVIVGRSRGYSIQPRGTVGSWNSRGSISSGGGRVSGPVRGSGNPSRETVAPPIDWRSRAPARPAREGVSRGWENGARGPSVVPDVPPARRSRPESYTYPARQDRGDAGDRGERSARGRPEARDYTPRDPSPARAEPSRREAPPPRAEGRPSGGGGGGGGGHSAPAHSNGGGRSRRP
jgi:hypothetical protein